MLARHTETATADAMATVRPHLGKAKLGKVKTHVLRISETDLGSHTHTMPQALSKAGLPARLQSAFPSESP